MWVYAVDCVFKPLEIGVEGGGGGVTVVESYSDEEKAGHAGVFVNETDVADSVVVVWKEG